MPVIVSLVLNKFWHWLEFKKITIFSSEIIFLVIAILKQDFGWLFSFNLVLIWYLVVFYFWTVWVNALLTFKRGRWPIFAFFGIFKLFVYTLPFFVTLIGEKYLTDVIFQIEASILGLLISFWILIIDSYKETKMYNVLLFNSKNNDVKKN